MQLQRHFHKVLQSLLKYIAPHHILLTPLETKYSFIPRHDMRNSRGPSNAHEPFVPRVYFLREHLPIDILSIEGAVDHEARIGHDGDFDYECNFAIGEGADAHPIQGDGQFGFGADFSEIRVNKDAA